MSTTLPLHAGVAGATRQPGRKPLAYFYNGNIRTMNGDHTAPHMLICGNRIWSCDSNPAPLGLDYRQAGFMATQSAMEADVEFIDLCGKTVLPGLVDSHVHFVWWSLNEQRADLTSARSEEDAIELLRQHAASAAPGDWLIGFGWTHNLWNNRQLPGKRSLDAAFPRNPVLLSSKCGHLAWANSAAFARAGLSSDFPDPPGGEIERTGQNGNRELTGILKETAISLIEQHVTRPSTDARLQAVRRGQKRAHSMGLTTLQTPEDLETWSFLQRFHLNDELTMRIHFWIPEAALDHLDELKIHSGFGDDFLRITAVKLFTDGSLGGRTALMYSPYENEPDNYGICVTDKEELKRKTLQANRAGLAMAIHAIGDKAIGCVLEAYEAAQDEFGISGAAGVSPEVRNRIEHLQVFAEQDVPLLKKVKPTASMQPIHLCADMGPADRFWGKRAKNAYAFKSLDAIGCLLAFGSDAPVEPINPFLGMFAAATRMNLQAEASSTWYPDERIGIQKIVEAYTKNPAIASGRSMQVGILASGMLADFIVLHDDPFSLPAAELRNVAPAATFVGGTCVFSAWDRMEASN
jgi:predicted amidohydrolase YtcJ